MRSWPAPIVPQIDGTPPPLRLYDTSDAEIKAVKPGETATMYVCGITPYDTTHLGHAATYLTFDLIYRALVDAGHQMHYVQNITDVDDPLFERAARDGVDWRDLGAAEVDKFRADMTALRILPPQDYVGVVDHVDEVIDMVSALLKSGAAYHLDPSYDGYSDVYFDISATPDFGYESRYDSATMTKFFTERGGDPDRLGKRHPLDALLWKQQRPGEPSWAASFGPGRPGWHIECSAFALNRLGMGFDVQGGGTDLIFPHHEFSAAHAEAATGENRFARFYVHSAMIGLDGEKMSKSLGNLVRVQQLRESGVDPSAIRLALAAHHYRSDRSWTQQLLEAAIARLEMWRSALDVVPNTDAAREQVLACIDRVRGAVANDLDTPAALAEIDKWATAARSSSGTSGEKADNNKNSTIMREALDALLGVSI